MRHFWIFAFAILFVLAGCSSQVDDSTNSPYTLENIYYYLQAVTDLEARDVLSSTDAEAQRTFYLAEAESITGEMLTEVELVDYLYSNTGQSWLRFLNFVNLIWVFASIIIVLSSAWIFARYIFPILKRIPIVVYEILLYIACAAFIFGGMSVEGSIRQFVALPGVLGLIPLLPFTYGYHIQGIRPPRRPTTPPDPDMPPQARVERPLEKIRRDFMLQYSALTLIWGAIALAYESVMIGVFTVLALMVAFALSPLIPFVVERLGFKRYHGVASALVVSFILVLIFLAANALNIGGAYTTVFEPGVFWIGTDVYFAALGILAARLLHDNKRWRYLRWQIISIVSGLVAMFIGAMWEIPEMQEIAGTYFLIYLLEKYVEMQNWRRHWAWASLGLGVLLYVAALVINRYPQFFLLQ